MGFFGRLFENLFGVSVKRQPGRTILPYRAVCYGINDYPGGGSDLRGCVNDAKNWASFGVNKLGFDPGGVKLIFDKDATKANIVSAWKWAIQGIQPGQLVLLTGSSHGSQVPDKDKDEQDAVDEVICCCDFSFDNPETYITDDEIASIFTPVPDGALVVFVADSCHSGTLNRAMDGKYMEPRRIVNAALANSNPKRRRIRKTIGTRAAVTGDPRNLIVMSGCLPTEFSYDAVYDNAPTGAFSYTVLGILNKSLQYSYAGLVKEVNKRIREPQHPQVYCTPDMRNMMVFKEARNA